MDQDSSSSSTETSSVIDPRQPFLIALEPIGDMLVIEHFSLGEKHFHYFPPDWIFGGADGCDPRTDPRWVQPTYVYFDSVIKKLWTSQTPICDEEALDDCSTVRTYGPRFSPWLIRKSMPGEEDMWLPWKYDSEKDEVYPWV